MDAIELLTDDHAALKKLLEQGDQTTERGVKTRTELLQRIKTELTAQRSSKKRSSTRPSRSTPRRRNWSWRPTRSTTSSTR